MDTSVAPPSADEAMAVFITGDVILSDTVNSTRRALEIGDILTADMAIEAGAEAYCELEFPNKAIVKILENTDIALSSILNSSGNTDISIKLNAGSVLCKVNKLAGNEDFRIITEVSVAGVRGTEFMVTIDDQKAATLAVREGAVLYYPVSLHRDTEDTIDYELFTAVEQELPLVEAGYQMVLTPVENVKISALAEQLKKDIESGESSLSDSAEELGKFIESSFKGAKKSLSDELRSILEQINTFRNTALSEEAESPVLIPLRVKTEPASAEISINGISAGISEISMMAYENQPVEVAAQLYGYIPASEIIIPSGKKENNITLSLGRIPPRSVNIRISPAGGKIRIEGEDEVSGEKNLTIDYTESMKILLTAAGFNRQMLTLKGSDDLEDEYTIGLEPEIHRSYRPSTTGVIGVTASGGLTISADSEGTLTAMKDDKKQWALSTINIDNRKCVPVSIGDIIAFSGQNEFILADSSSGNQILTTSLDLPDKHMFGRRVIEAGEFIVFPGNEVLKFYNHSGELIRETDIPEGSRMYPLFDGEHLYIVNLQGELLAYNLDGSIQSRLNTEASKLIGVSLAGEDNRAYFGDQKGQIFAVSLNPLKILWTTSASNTRKVVFSDTLCTAGENVFAYYQGSLFGFNGRNGEALFEPKNGFTTPPLSYNGYLYAGAGTDGVMIIDPANGETVKMIGLDEHVMESSLSVVNGRIAVPCRDGWVYEINPLVRY